MSVVLIMNELVNVLREGKLLPGVQSITVFEVTRLDGHGDIEEISVPCKNIHIIGGTGSLGADTLTRLFHIKGAYLHKGMSFLRRTPNIVTIPIRRIIGVGTVVAAITPDMGCVFMVTAQNLRTARKAAAAAVGYYCHVKGDN